jgi:hypothetical protein
VHLTQCERPSERAWFLQRSNASTAKLRPTVLALALAALVAPAAAFAQDAGENDPAALQ